MRPEEQIEQEMRLLLPKGSTLFGCCVNIIKKQNCCLFTLYAYFPEGLLPGEALVSDIWIPPMRSLHTRIPVLFPAVHKLYPNQVGLAGTNPTECLDTLTYKLSLLLHNDQSLSYQIL